MTEARVLMVDDAAGVRRDLGKTLTRGGFAVTFASDCASGWKAYREGRFDLVVLDLVMPDFEGRINKSGGILLLERITGGATLEQPAPPVWILTATADAETRREALEKGASKYLDKAELYNCLGELLAEIAAAARPETTPEPPRAAERASRPAPEGGGSAPQIRSGGVSLDPAEEALLLRLYRDCSTIRLSPLASSFRGSRTFRVDCVDRDGVTTLPFVSKLGPGDSVRAEDEAFRRYVRYKVGSARYAELIDTAFSPDGALGANRMAFVGTEWSEVVDLRSYFQQHSAEEVRGALESLFEHTLGPWHRSKEPAQPLGLVAAYDLFGGPSKVREGMNHAFRQQAGQQLLSLDLCPKPFFEPARALTELLTAFADLRVETHRSTIHGDLNVSNVLVDAKGACWLIDFQQTTVGPILRDFIELESSLKYSCLETSPEALWSLEQAVMAQRDFRQELRLEHPDPQLVKALTAVRTIREHAFYAVAPSRDMTEYYFGLLLHTLGLLRFPKRVLDTGKKKVALLAAALLFDRFKKPGQRMGFVDPVEQRRYAVPSEEERATIVLVDDDTHLRKDVAKRLERTGRYRVVQASDTRGAIEVLDQHGKEAALCIVDMEMPGLDGEQSKTAGLDLLELLRGRLPLLPVAVLSGATDQKLAIDAMRRCGAVTFMRKADAASDPKAFLDEIEEIIVDAGREEMERRQKRKATALFRSTLPKALPRCEGVEGALFSKSYEEVGGDLYDGARVSDHELRVLLADATGHGWPGAVAVMRLKAFYHSGGLPDTGSLVESVSEWNRYVFEQKAEGNEHLTLFVGNLDLRDGRLTYCNAGHDPPFVVTASGKVETLPATGPLIGAVPDAPYTVAERKLKAGDVLVLYTDGFVESESPEGVEVGVDWLRRAVYDARERSAEDIRQAILEVFDRLADPQRIDDDRTLIVLKLAPAAAVLADSTSLELEGAS